MSDLDACAALVLKADPARFRTAMLAPMPVRGDLMALYAMNVEVSRAPFASSEPMIAEMRVQWWADAVGEIYDGTPRRHEVVTPLADAVRRHGLARATLEALVEARRAECWPGPLSVEGFIDATAGGLMELAAGMLGGFGGARDLGWGAGAAALIRALPAYAGHGRDVGVADVAALAREGLARRARARKGRAARAVHPALLAGWEADAVLRDALRRGEAVREAPFAASEFSRRAGLALRAALGRW